MKKINKAILYNLLFCIFFVSLVSGANWVAHPLDCPVEYNSVSCTGGDLQCGVNPVGDIPYCFDMSLLNAPGSDDTSQAGDTYQSGLSAGFIVDCEATNGAEPYCSNSDGLWCNRNITCYSTNYRTSICKANTWSNDTSQTDCGLCRTNYYNCYGDTKCESTSTSNCEGNKQNTKYDTGTCVDGSGGGTCQCDTGYINCTAPVTTDGCEVDYGTTNCASGSNNNINSTCGCVCDSGYLDCDASGAGTGNGCEVEDTGSCSVGSLVGTYSGCTCVVDKSYFETGTFIEYQTNDSQGGMLWFKDHSGTRWLINISNVDNETWAVNSSGCIKFMDDTWQCTASSGTGMDYTNLALTNMTNVFTGNQNITGNLTIGDKIIFAFGEIIDNLIDGWLRITGSLWITGDLNVTGSITGENLTTRSNLICNETVCFTLQDLNTTGGGGGTDTWASNYTFYYNKSEIDNNLSLYLLLTDQRFNETDLVNSINTTANIMSLGFYNKSEVDNNFSLYLLLTDQRFNETSLINSINTSQNIQNLGFYNQSEVDNNFTLYYTKGQIDNNFTFYYTKSEVDNNFSLYYTKIDVDNNFSLYYTKTQIDNNLSLYYTKIEVDNNLSNYILTTSESDLNVNSSQSLNTSIGYVKDVNDTQFNLVDYILSIDISWLTSLFYEKSEVYNKTETYNKSEIDANITGQGYITNTNVAYTNQTNTFTEDQTFNKNINVDGNITGPSGSYIVQEPGVTTIVIV